MPRDPYVAITPPLPQAIYDFRTNDADRRPSILVVVPTYNSEKWIGACLESLAANGEPHDVLIVDNGPTSIKDVVSPSSNMVIMRLPCGVGLTNALNAAIKYCLDEGYLYLARQDSDDISHPTRLETQRALAECNDADLVVSPARIVDEHGAELWVSSNTKAMADIKRALHVSNPFIHSSYFLRSSAFSKIGGYSTEFPGAEDFELLHRLSSVGQIVSSDAALIDYVVHSESILGSSKLPGRSTSKILMKYFNPFEPASYYGLMRSEMARRIPRRLKTSLRFASRRFTDGRAR